MLLFILVILGLSITSSNTQPIQEKIDAYDEQIEQSNVNENNSYVSVNKMKENNASSLAKGVSNVIQFSFTSGVKLVYIMFENIINE